LGDAPKDAQQRLRILRFLDKHGLAATVDAFGVSERTLYRWRQKLRQAGGNPAALADILPLLPSKPLAVLSDNGSEFEAGFARLLQQNGIQRWYTYPKTTR